jgi:hypothetical protein
MAFPVLGRLTGSAGVRRAGRGVKSAWKRAFFWPLNSARKARFETLGIRRNATLAIAQPDFAASCDCKAGANFVPLSQDAVRGFARSDGRRTRARRFSETAAMIDLQSFASFDEWRVGVSQRTSGKYHRSANKARRLGYTSRPVGKDSYAQSLYRLTGSKLRRSKGLVVWAAIAGPRADLVDTKAPEILPTCARHWRICWGSFSSGADGEQLAAFAMLIRAGDTVWVQRFIGHGAALTDGVTKMLMFDIMAWLLKRDEPATQGVRYLLHGSIEEGAAGLFDWKRYLGFQPMLLGLSTSAPMLRHVVGPGAGPYAPR